MSDRLAQGPRRGTATLLRAAIAGALCIYPFAVAAGGCNAVFGIDELSYNGDTPGGQAPAIAGGGGQGAIDGHGGSGGQEPSGGHGASGGAGGRGGAGGAGGAGGQGGGQCSSIEQCCERFCSVVDNNLCTTAVSCEPSCVARFGSNPACEAKAIELLRCYDQQWSTNCVVPIACAAQAGAYAYCDGWDGCGSSTGSHNIDTATCGGHYTPSGSGAGCDIGYDKQWECSKSTYTCTCTLTGYFGHEFAITSLSVVCQGSTADPCQTSNTCCKTAIPVAP
jgi:hypothetical protein